MSYLILSKFVERVQMYWRLAKIVLGILVLAICVSIKIFNKICAVKIIVKNFVITITSYMRNCSFIEVCFSRIVYVKTTWLMWLKSKPLMSASVWRSTHPTMRRRRRRSNLCRYNDCWTVSRRRLRAPASTFHTHIVYAPAPGAQCQRHWTFAVGVIHNEITSVLRRTLRRRNGF